MTAGRPHASRLDTAATVALAVLAAVAAGVGLLVPDVYRDSEPLLAQIYGQDLVTALVAVPVLLVALAAARRGSRRGEVVRLGVVGYLLYTYGSYAVMTVFNELYLVYVALFGLSLFAFLGGMLGREAATLGDAVEGHSTRPYAVFFVLTTALIALAWLGDVVPAILAGTVPDAIAGTGLPTPVIQSLDLAVLLPALALTAYFLRDGRPWAYAVTGVLLVKIATLGLAVLTMGMFQARAGDPAPVPLIAIFGLLTVTAIGLSVRFVRSIGAPVDPGSSSAVEATVRTTGRDSRS